MHQLQPVWGFDDEADTVPLEIESDTASWHAVAYEPTQLADLPRDTLVDDNPMMTAVQQIDDTAILELLEETRPRRASTDADWPPPPKQPANRARRPARIYKAISSITKLTAIKPSAR